MLSGPFCATCIVRLSVCSKGCNRTSVPGRFLVLLSYGHAHMLTTWNILDADTKPRFPLKEGILPFVSCSRMWSKYFIIEAFPTGRGIPIPASESLPRSGNPPPPDTSRWPVG